MAWIKMRTDLRSDPSVIGLAELTGLDVHGVIGRLHVVWGWADSVSRDGHVRTVTPSALVRHVDTEVAHEGFADAMVAVGWLRVESDKLSFPNFDRHMSKSAKERGLAAERQSRHRRDTLSRIKRDKSVTREDKSRGEKKKTPSLRSGVARASKRRPEDVVLDDDRMREAREIGLTETEIAVEWAKMGDHQYREARSDWPAAWRNWCRGAIERRRPTPPDRPDLRNSRAAVEPVTRGAESNVVTPDWKVRAYQERLKREREAAEA